MISISLNFKEIELRYRTWTNRSDCRIFRALWPNLNKADTQLHLKLGKITLNTIKSNKEHFLKIKKIPMENGYTFVIYVKT